MKKQKTPRNPILAVCVWDSRANHLVLCVLGTNFAISWAENPPNDGGKWHCLHCKPNLKTTERLLPDFTVLWFGIRVKWKWVGVNSKPAYEIHHRQTEGFLVLAFKRQ